MITFHECHWNLFSSSWNILQSNAKTRVKNIIYSLFPKLEGTSRSIRLPLFVFHFHFKWSNSSWRILKRATEMTWLCRLPAADINTERSRRSNCLWLNRNSLRSCFLFFWRTEWTQRTAWEILACIQGHQCKASNYLSGWMQSTQHNSTVFVGV